MINDPQIVKFSNEVLRPAADQLGRAYYSMLELRNAWNALDLENKIPDNDKETVEDGADVDGRTVITGADLHALFNQANAFVTDFDNGSGAKRNAVLKIAVNPR